MSALTLTVAKEIIAATLAKGEELGFLPLSAVVVDAGGHPIAFERSDGSSPGRFRIAYGKANGVVMMGLAGHELFARSEKFPTFMASLNGAFDGAFLPVPGGVLIRDAEGAVLGAVGVTGDTSGNDATAGLAGIKAVGLVGEA